MTNHQPGQFGPDASQPGSDGRVELLERGTLGLLAAAGLAGLGWEVAVVWTRVLIHITW